MKKNILILFALCAVMTSYSQTEKGKMFIGGQLNFSNDKKTSNLDYADSIEFTIAPNIAYFIKDNFAIGANFNLSTSNYSDKTYYTTYYYPINTPPYTIYTLYNSSKTSSLNYGIGGFARYYIKIIDKFKFYIHGSINYSYQSTNTTQTDGSNENLHGNEILLAVSPGLVYFITPKLGLEASFGNINYSYSKNFDNNLPIENQNTTGSRYGINLNSSTLFLGLNYYF